MELYFLRHGIAADRSHQGVGSDAERPLTEEGIEKLKKSLVGMKRLDVVPDRIVSSPYVRALQTARIVAEGLGFEAKIDVSEALVPEAELEDFWKILARAPAESRWLFVGHEPSISDFIGQLIASGKSARVDMKKGGLARVDGGPDGGRFLGTLEWLLTPRQLCSLT